MTRRFAAINPFYPLLVLAGSAFAITALAYGIMALKAMSPAGSGSEHSLLVFLDRHGMALMAVELGLLAASSLLAMATDSYWSPRPAAAPEADASQTANRPSLEQR